MSDLTTFLSGFRTRSTSFNQISTEILRKSIHLLIALVPTLATWNMGFTVALLASGTIIYAYSEMMRLRGFEIIFISKITAMAARKRDAGKFVLGPVTLGVGAMLALLLYPNPAASIAIYALAFGDGLSSLVGRIFGTIKIPFTGGKSVEGSLTCFVAVLSSSYAITGDFAKSGLLALVATFVEVLPTKDMDNILLPVVTGVFAVLLL